MAPNKNRKVSRNKSKKKLWLAIGIIAIAVIVVGVYELIPTLSPSSNPSTNSTKVLLQTSMGDITIQLRDDKPITSANFKSLVQQGKYDNTIFHRVIAGFMIQGGAINEQIPTIPDEIGSNNRNVAYTIAMAKTSQPNSATSQFFINVADNGNNPIDSAGTKFDSVYTVFGSVTSGLNVVDAIANAQVTTNAYGENSQPVQPVTLIKATILP